MRVLQLAYFGQRGGKDRSEWLVPQQSLPIVRHSKNHLKISDWANPMWLSALNPLIWSGIVRGLADQVNTESYWLLLDASAAI